MATNQGASDPVAERDEALRKIGRNVVLFQELEGILKFLAAIQRPSAPLSKIKAVHAKDACAIRVRSLGQVGGQVLDALYGVSNSESSAPDAISEPWLAFSFRIDADPASGEASRNALKELIRERNDLVHHLLSRWNLREPESSRALSVELDEQRSRIVHEIERYRAYANGLKEIASELRAFIDSDEGKRFFDLVALQQSRLVATLTSVATENARADGWTLLSTAGHRLSQLLPDEFSRLKKLHGEGSLEKLVRATQRFEVRSEPTQAGGTRVIYRPDVDGENSAQRSSSIVQR